MWFQRNFVSIIIFIVFTVKYEFNCGMIKKVPGGRLWELQEKEVSSHGTCFSSQLLTIHALAKKIFQSADSINR